MINFRSDLALEHREALNGLPRGVSSESEQIGKATVTRIEINGEEGRTALHRPDGRYITVELPRFSDYVDDENAFAPVIAKELQRLLPAEGLALVVGLGNAEITPDAIGPQAAAKILATRHLTDELTRVSGLERLRPVAVIAPNVLGKTGIEAAELLDCLARRLCPSVLIVIDALMARSLSRLGNTVQLSDSGITPGSGVGNFRRPVTRENIGLPVVTVGVPTVVEGKTLLEDLSGVSVTEEKLKSSAFMVTPREIDLLVERAARMTALAVNCALQPALSLEEIMMLQA